MCEQNFNKQSNPQFRIYIANMNKYNENELVGGWINLPTAFNEIKTFLKNQVELNPCDEYFIYDYESAFSFDEFENIYELNVLAVKLEQLSENEKNIVDAYCKANNLKDTQSILNTCQQTDNLAYVTLDANTWETREEKLGYTMLEEIDTDLKNALEQCKIGSTLSAYDYFDFEKYGRDIAIAEGYFANDNLFIFYTIDINHKLYTVKEIKNQLNDSRLDNTKQTT
jgi:antirestriction protein